MKTRLKFFLQHVAPSAFSALQRIHQRWHVQCFEKRHHLPKVKRAFCARYELKVMHGPFEGMQYVSHAVGSAFVPKLLGCYEQELHSILNSVIRHPYKRIIDVGCAEGYYAVGFARRMSAACIYAFDINAEARSLCKAMAQANGVSKSVIVEGECTTDTLQALGGAEAFIVCDCEGAEIDLLDPIFAPKLLQTDLLVELHDNVNPIITAALHERFADTHDITLITSVPRDCSAYPEVEFLEPALRIAAVSEFRFYNQQWAFMQTKQRSRNSV